MSQRALRRAELYIHYICSGISLNMQGGIRSDLCRHCLGGGCRVCGLWRSAIMRPATRGHVSGWQPESHFLRMMSDDREVKNLKELAKGTSFQYNESEYCLRDKSDEEIEMNQKSVELEPEERFLEEENSEAIIEDKMEKKEESLVCDLQPTIDHAKDKIQSTCLEIWIPSQTHGSPKEDMDKQEST
ncbi:hypothetical protein SUGI_0072690 [Cryptomeria japonica]|nr:hypothetical protein SUGI_0072690 [Cryptomeria japonica]